MERLDDETRCFLESRRKPCMGTDTRHAGYPRLWLRDHSRLVFLQKRRSASNAVASLSCNELLHGKRVELVASPPAQILASADRQWPNPGAGDGHGSRDRVGEGTDGGRSGRSAWPPHACRSAQLIDRCSLPPRQPVPGGRCGKPLGVKARAQPKPVLLRRSPLCSGKAPDGSARWTGEAEAPRPALRPPGAAPGAGL